LATPFWIVKGEESWGHESGNEQWGHILRRTMTTLLKPFDIFARTEKVHAALQYRLLSEISD
jgi:hypothetical protein